MSFVSMLQGRGSAQRAAPLTSSRETAQQQEQRWPLPSVCGPSGPQQRRRCVRTGASSPRIPSSTKEVARGPFTSSSNLKRKWAQREKIARNHLSVCPPSSNSQRESCCVHDEWELGVIRLSVPLPTLRVILLLKWKVSRWLRESCICFVLHTQKIKRSFMLSFYTNTAVLLLCLHDITKQHVREFRAREKCEFQVGKQIKWMFSTDR